MQHCCPQSSDFRCHYIKLLEDNFIFFLMGSDNSSDCPEKEEKLYLLYKYYQKKGNFLFIERRLTIKC